MSCNVTPLLMSYRRDKHECGQIRRLYAINGWHLAVTTAHAPFVMMFYLIDIKDVRFAGL